ncbi:hypothetical protein JW865_08785 [Candidatus Bathyarchaeota archaeon]|nr:hypothetical protein [Candidatus Bathyarchaeota archaeon]
MDEHEHKRHREDIPVEEITALLDAVNTRLPSLIKNLLDSLYSPEAATKMGKAVADFRKALIDGGIPEAEAMEMTKQYLSTLNLISRSANGKGFRMEKEKKDEEE